MNTPNSLGLLFNTKVCGVNLLFFTNGKLEHIDDLRLAKCEKIEMEIEIEL